MQRKLPPRLMPLRQRSAERRHIRRLPIAQVPSLHAGEALPHGPVKLRPRRALAGLAWWQYRNPAIRQVTGCGMIVPDALRLAIGRMAPAHKPPTPVCGEDIVGVARSAGGHYRARLAQSKVSAERLCQRWFHMCPLMDKLTYPRRYSKRIFACRGTICLLRQRNPAANAL